MGITVANLEGWIGIEVLDLHGDKIGKVSDFYFQGTDALLVDIASGLGGRKHHLAPLGEAVLTRDHLQLGAGSLVQTAGGLGASELAELGLQYPALRAVLDQRLESFKSREEHRKAAEAAAARASSLEAQVAKHATEEHAAVVKAEDASAEAARARLAKEQAEEEARLARQEVALHATSPGKDAP